MTKPKGVMHQVTVTAGLDGGGNFTFDPTSRLWNGREQHFAFNKRDHDMDDQDYHVVEFVLNDDTGRDLRFPSQPHEAMWVAKVNDPKKRVCPDSSSKSDYQVIDPMCVSPDGQRLIVRNEDSRNEDWSFTLNFLKAGKEKGASQDYVSWDPIIKNGGNGSA